MVHLDDFLHPCCNAARKDCSGSVGTFPCQRGFTSLGFLPAEILHRPWQLPGSVTSRTVHRGRSKLVARLAAKRMKFVKERSFHRASMLTRPANPDSTVTPRWQGSVWSSIFGWEGTLSKKHKHITLPGMAMILDMIQERQVLKGGMSRSQVQVYL